MTFGARRVQNWVLVGLLYSFFYMSRYNFSAIVPDLMAFFGWSKGEHISIFETILPTAYGLSVAFNGPLADRVGGRRAFLFGAAGVVVMNTLFGLFSLVVAHPAHGGEPAQLLYGFTPTSLAWTMAIVWAVNGYFQSFGALSIVKINAHWFESKDRGRFAAIFGVLIRFGLILAFSGCPLIAGHFGWQYAFFVPAIFVAILFVLVFLFVVDKPEDAGFPAVGPPEGASGDKVNVAEILKKVATNPVMWTIAVGSMMIGITRRSLIDAWWPTYMKEVHHVAKEDVAYQVTAWALAIGGIAGGFLFGWLSDRVFQTRRAPVVVFGFIGVVLVLMAFAGLDAIGAGPWGACASIVALSFCINGAHGMIGGAASMDFGGKRAAGTAAGLFDGIQYLAAAPIAGRVVPYIAEHMGWQMWKLLTIPWAVAGALIMLRIWNATPRGSPGH
jgi:OPA family glycerol-3-phosphate transporter-like MFS transporter